jgi:hypothetical protein
MKHQNITQKYDMSYLTPDIIKKQNRVDFFGTLMQVFIGATFIVGLIAWVFAGQLDRLKTLRMAEIWKEQKDSDKEITSLKATTESEKYKRIELENANLQLKINLEKLELATRDRVIPSALIPSFQDTLSSYKNYKVSIEYQSSSYEAINFAAQLIQLFKSSGWEVIEYPGQHYYSGGMFRGIIIRSDKDHYWSSNAIAKFFEKMSLIVNSHTIVGNDDTINIKIGDK